MNETIVTGQQIGLLGGPLYTTYKVLGAIYLSRQIGGNAVYWLETNDADFNEINRIDYLDDENELHTLLWNIPSAGFSCGHIEVDKTLVDLLAFYFNTLRRTEFTDDLKDMALSCYTEGTTLAEASQKLAAELFGDFGIRIFTPFEREFKDFIQPILRKEAERTPDDEQCNFFCMKGKQRKAIFKKGGRFLMRDGTELDLSIETLVPNVKTRSVCQDAFFKTHTYVAGPAEVQYLSELDPVYRYHGVKKAAVQPRMSISIIEPRVRRLLKRTGFTLQEISETPREDILKKALNEGAAFDFDSILRSGNGLTEEYLGKLASLGLEESEMKEIRKTLRDNVKNALGSLRAREKEKNRKILEDTGYLSDNLRPFGKPQERVFNIFHYMNLFGGKNVIKKLFDLYDFNRKLLEIGE